MKNCTNCKKDKEDKDFSKGNSWCKTCDNSYHKQHYQDNKQYYIDKSKRQRQKLKDYILSYKQEHPCSKCGESSPFCLDFHHLRDKDDCVSQIVNKGRSVERLMEEIEKCIILCANCHRKLHRTEI